MKNAKRLLSVILALCMLMAVCVVSVSAELTDGATFATFEDGTKPAAFTTKNGGTMSVNTDATFAKGVASLKYSRPSSSPYGGIVIDVSDKPANCVGIAFDYIGNGWAPNPAQYFRVIAANNSGFSPRIIDDVTSPMATQTSSQTEWSRMEYDFREMYKQNSTSFATDYADIEYLWLIPQKASDYLDLYFDNFTYLVDGEVETPDGPAAPTGIDVTYNQAFADFDNMADDALNFFGRQNYEPTISLKDTGNGKALNVAVGESGSYSGVRFLTKDYPIPEGAIGFTFDFKNISNASTLGVILAAGKDADGGGSRIEILTNAVPYNSYTDWRTYSYTFGSAAKDKLAQIGQIVFYYPQDGSNYEFQLDNLKWIVETKVDGDATLPTATAPAGKQFIGWLNATDSKLYKAGAIYPVTAETTFTAINSAVETQEGAGIRWAEQQTERGLRFETFVTKSAMDTIGSSAFTVGTLILPASKYDASLTVDNAASYTAVNVVDDKFYGTTGANYRYYGAVVDMEKYFGAQGTAANELALAAVGYATVTYEDGSTKTFYSAFDASKNVRCAAQVANAALKDTSANYSDKQIEILKLYCPETLAEDTTVAYRTDAKDFA